MQKISYYLNETYSKQVLSAYERDESLSAQRSSYGHIWTGDGVDLALWIRSNTLSQLWPPSPKKSASRPWHAMPCSDRTSTKASLCQRRHVMPVSRSDPFSVGLPDAGHRQTHDALS